MMGLGDTAYFQLTLKCVENALEFTKSWQITKVRIFVHIHGDEIGGFNRR